MIEVGFVAVAFCNFQIPEKTICTGSFGVIGSQQFHKKPQPFLTGAFRFRNLYLITQRDYLTVTFLAFDHWLNTFVPSSDVLLNAWRPA